MGNNEKGKKIGTNYIMIVIGCFAFPFAIYSAFFARRNARLSEGWEKSHYEFQAKLSKIVLSVLLFYFFIISIIYFSLSDLGNSSRHKIITYLSESLYIFYIWVFVVSVRGFYLSKTSRFIRNAITSFIWPR